jgi:hypothetical protein
LIRAAILRRRIANRIGEQRCPLFLVGSVGSKIQWDGLWGDVWELLDNGLWLMIPSHTPEPDT